MKREKKPSPLFDRAREGDEEAMGDLLGGIVAPIFDLSWHALADIERARNLTISAMRESARLVRDGSLSADDVQDVATHYVLREALDVKEAPRPLAFGELGEKLEHFDGLVLLAAWVAELTPAETAGVLGVPLTRIRRSYERALERLGEDEDHWREQLDHAAAGVTLPNGMIEEALGLED